ncbi:MAG TPA: hypothetical protein PKK69_04515, partial [Ferruginibacter sp.]|nr:hypothetical protein [Ferruginibacter sp.]
ALAQSTGLRERQWDEAIAIYNQQISNEPENLTYRHDRALALFQKGDAAAAAQAYLDLLEQDNALRYYETYFTMGWTELNALYHQYGKEIPASLIDSNWIRHTPMDLYVSTYGSESLYGLRVKEPSNQTMYNYWNSSNRFPNTGNYYSSYNSNEYACIHADTGVYRFSIPCYYHYQPDANLHFVRWVSIQHYQQPGQQIRVQHALLNNQYGEVEFAALQQSSAR